MKIRYIQGDSEIGSNILGTCSATENKAKKLHINMGPKTLFYVEIDPRMVGDSKWSI
jgi:hypothetical protein